MAFDPDKITKQNILDAISKIETENIELTPSTKFDVIINDKPYPPKEVMRYAHGLMNGEHIWEKTGGNPTNKYLTDLGFEIKIKNHTRLSEPPITGNIWKLGCNWGSGNPSFYNFIKRKEIIIGVEKQKYAVGDLIAVTEGHRVKAIAMISENPIPVTDDNSLKESFNSLQIDYDSWVNFAKADWLELDQNETFDYKLQQGICKVQDAQIRKKIINLWNNRNSNYWIFQGNPTIFDFEAAIRNNLLEDWTVTAHKEKIKIGDKIILWISGRNAGCYALAKVTSAPQIIPNSKDSKLWKTEDKNQLKSGIKITHNLIDTPLLWDTIKGTKGLENLKVGNQGTNFTATKEEYKIIYDLINNSSESKNIEVMLAKNIILYGPPGTGKTYNSIDKAVEIATGELSAEHDENKKQFDELRKQGQIEFVTFHQNYSYEDFMVGIRPNLEEESENLTFKKHYGIFYEIVQRAKNDSPENFETLEVLSETKKPFEEVFNEFIAPLIEKKENEIEVEMARSSFFIHKVEGNHIDFRKSKGKSVHQLLIDNVKNMYEKESDLGFTGLVEYYRPLKDTLLELGKKKVFKKKNYVIVIDEINRANISKVFGELITLLEDDKRLGEPNELKITLPNGEKEFGVPSNLYIIGTMNTADKSIALIDIALRRRFEFIGYYPTIEVLDKLQNEGLITPEKTELLKRINKVIYKKRNSADYLIGHAYFINDKSIEEVLRNKVVPLLMEYFSGKTKEVSDIFSETKWLVVYDEEKYGWNISSK